MFGNGLRQNIPRPALHSCSYRERHVLRTSRFLIVAYMLLWAVEVCKISHPTRLKHERGRCPDPRSPQAPMPLEERRRVRLPWENPSTYSTHLAESSLRHYKSPPSIRPSAPPPLSPPPPLPAARCRCRRAYAQQYPICSVRG